jgi:hypothetical protein
MACSGDIRAGKKKLSVPIGIDFISLSMILPFKAIFYTEKRLDFNKIYSILLLNTTNKLNFYQMEKKNA